MFSLLLLIIWLLGTVASFGTFSYLEGVAEKKVEANTTIVDVPPYSVGLWTCWAWPIQVAACGALFLRAYARGAGNGKGIEDGQELAELRELRRKFDEQTDLNLRILTDRHVDPDNIDEATQRMLTVAAIRAAMEDDSHQKALERAHRKDQREDLVIDILDKSGKVVRDPLDLTDNQFDQDPCQCEWEPEGDPFITTKI